MEAGEFTGGREGQAGHLSGAHEHHSMSEQLGDLEEEVGGMAKHYGSCCLCSPGSPRFFSFKKYLTCCMCLAICSSSLCLDLGWLSGPCRLS